MLSSQQHPGTNVWSGHVNVGSASSRRHSSQRTETAEPHTANDSGVVCHAVAVRPAKAPKMQLGDFPHTLKHFVSQQNLGVTCRPTPDRLEHAALWCSTPLQGLTSAYTMADESKVSAPGGGPQQVANVFAESSYMSLPAAAVWARVRELDFATMLPELVDSSYVIKASPSERPYCPVRNLTTMHVLTPPCSRMCA